MVRRGPGGRRDARGQVRGRRVAGGSHALQAREARDAVRALGVELVAQARGGHVALVVREVAAVAVFDGDGGELGHGGCG